MLRAAVKSIAGHKLRLFLMALAIVSGVAFVSGTFILTDTLRAAFSDVFSELNSGIDVSVRAEAAFTSVQSATGGRARVPADLVDDIRALPDVAAADGVVVGYAQFLDKDGKAIAPQGPPTLGVNWNESDELNLADLREGRAPLGPGEVAMDAFTAEDNGFVVGDRVRILTILPPEEFEIVGIFGFGELDNFLGATVAAFETAEAQRLTDSAGEFTSIDVAAAPGVTREEAQAAIAAILPSGFEAVTQDVLNDEASDQINEGFLDIFNIFLLVFAGVAVFVGAFIIANTFSIIVSQRRKELALLRAVGASGGQVTMMVLAEALLVALVASAVGIVAGALVAIGLKGAFAAFGADLPSTGLVFQARTIIVGMVVGVVVTSLAAVVPALSASRVPPIAAMRDVSITPKATGGRRAAFGSGLTGLGVVLLLVGLFTGVGNAFLLLGMGVILVFLGVAFLSPLFAGRVANIVGWPAHRLFGMIGLLARENATRRPVRTAATAAALMIGVALVSFAMVFTESLTVSAGAVIEDAVAADLIVSTPASGPPLPISPQLARDLEALPEIDVATGVRFGEFEYEGDRKQLGAIDPARILEVTNVDFVVGSVADLAGPGFAVHVDAAADLDWSVGDVVTVTFAATGVQQVPVVGIYEAEEALIGSFTVGYDFHAANFPDALDFIVFANVAAGVDAADAEAAVQPLEERYPNVEFQSLAEFRQSTEDALAQLLAIVSVLLTLALIIALLGITNTLALSVVERTREIGLLRAVGLSRRQTRRMVRYEAMIIAAFGALLGVGLGVFFGFVVVRAAADFGFNAFAIPVGSLVTLLIIATLAGVFAATSPARRAAKLNILEAIAYE